MRRNFRSLVLIVAFAAVLCCVNSHVPIAEATNYPTAKVTSVAYPQLVSSGSPFQVDIHAEYSDKFLADVGIWDAAEGMMVQSLTLISQFTGPGNVTFQLSLKAPSISGHWNLIAINRVWWQDAWYEDPNGGSRPFAVTVSSPSSNVTLTLGSVSASAQIVVDSVSYQIQNGSFTPLTLQRGPHTLQAPLIVQGDIGVRYVFVGWSDGVHSDPHQIFLTQSTTMTALYRTEYYLSAQSDWGEVVGEGWYEKGTQATVAVTPTITVPSFIGSTDEYRFNGWSGDSSSTNYLLTLTMDGPKQVNATWIEKSTGIDQGIMVDLLLLGCLLLGARLFYVRYRHRSRGTRSAIEPAGPVIRFICLGLILLIVSMTFPAALAQMPSQPRASIVKIGDAEWYYWNRPGGDTCLLWLGGGIPQEAEPGSYGYLINPFDYESFGTIRFIQSLTSFYCVLALQRGSTEGFNPAANRTIYQELFTPQTRLIEEVHEWIIGQGYQHTFVVGYSVGGQAATAELTLSQSQEWSTQDGLILITVPFGQDVLKNANELRTNLFIIYGGNLPDYEATGSQYFNGTSREGPAGTQYTHKEFHVIEDVGHEVWTVRATGAYDTRALNLIVGFIERSKVLQLPTGLEPAAGNSAGASAQISSVLAPEKVAEGEAFVVDCNLTLSPAGGQKVLAAYDRGRSLVLSETALANSSGVVPMVIPPILNGSESTISLIVFKKSNGNWSQASNAYSVNVAVTNLVTVTINSSVPGIVFSFDGTQFTTNSSGLAEIHTSPGQHTIQVQPFVYLSNDSRYRFIGWEDSPNSTMRQLNLDGDTALDPVYTQQYLIRVNSPYGETSGSGWYDTNSLATIFVQPPMLNEPPVVFSNWTTGMNQSQVRTIIPVGSPTVVNAEWNSTPNPQEVTSPWQNPWLILSALAFIILLVLNLKERRKSGNV